MSAPQLSAASSERVLYVARPLRLGDGTHLLALAQVPVDALVPVLMQGLSMPDLEVTLERGRGEMLIGVAAQQSLVERTQAAGPPLGEAGGIAADSWQASARLSGAPAMVSARPLLYPDLWITASLPRGAALAAWEEEARSMALVALLFGASVVLASPRCTCNACMVRARWRRAPRPRWTRRSAPWSAASCCSTRTTAWCSGTSASRKCFPGCKECWPWGCRFAACWKPRSTTTCPA
jgi:hypothetical protein